MIVSEPSPAAKESILFAAILIRHCFLNNSCVFVLLSHRLRAPTPGARIPTGREGCLVPRSFYSMGRFHFFGRCWKSTNSLRGVLGAILFLLALSLVARSQEAAESSLHGTVRDSQGKPVVEAVVHLQAKDSPKSLTARTDSRGNYSFNALLAGTYALRAESAGKGEAAVSSVLLRTKERKNIDLVLGRATPIDAGKAPEFFDQPQFTVAGVTDTTNLGGHGSDTIVRTRDSLARETASLGKGFPQPEPPAGKPGDYMRAYDGARTDAAAGRLQQARDQVQSLLKDHDDAELHHLHAEIEEKMGDSLEAVREYQRAAELEASEHYWFDWGTELLLHHAPEPAIEVFSKGNRLFPGSVRMLVGLGVAWFAHGSHDLAVQKLCQASDLDPSQTAPYLFLGKIAAVEPVPSEKLVGKLHRFADLHPQSAQANYYLALALWKRHRSPRDRAAVAQVETLLNKAIRLDSQFAAAYLQLGVLQSERGDLQRAISNYQHAVQAAPEMAEAHYRLAQAYRQAGEAAKSKEELRLYQQVVKESAKQADRERHEIRQFVYTLRDQPPSRPQ